MIDIELNPINFLLLLPIVHFMNIILCAWMPHFLLHQRFFGVPLYKIHFYSHHQHQSTELSLFQSYFLTILEHFLWISFIGFVGIIYQVVFVKWIVYFFIGDALLCALAIYYLHLEYDNSQSWLKKYKWFTNARKLHQIHHAYSQKEIFSKSKNYSFGGFGLCGHIADRIMGTFQPVKIQLKSDHD